MGFKVSFIGSGNVATNLAFALDKAGHTINQVISRNEEKARLLARNFGAYYGAELSKMYKDSDFVIICVTDSAYEEILSNLPRGMKAIVCHTAGAVPMETLESYSGDYGVLYPLQSFRKETIKDFLDVPVFLEYSSKEVKKKLFNLADSISNTVVEVNSEEREKYHLSAVFANNFTNLMYTLADSYLTKEGLDFKYLHPIIKETADRLKQGKPELWQTGPAKRKDFQVIEKHISMLEDDRKAMIYQQLSNFLITDF